MINNIQILRAFAALNVVLFHILGASEDMGFSPGSLQFLAGWGESGVDIFFVISGFVMVVAHANKDISPIRFMILRIERIAPIYWLLTLLILSIYLVMPQLVKSVAPSSGQILASLFFLSGALFDKHPVVYVGWTLEYEMFFYFMFAASLTLPRGACRFVFLLVAMCVALGFGGASSLLSEFLFGVLAGELFLRQSLRSHSALLLCVGVFLLCVSIFFKTEWSRLIIWGIPSLMIVLGAASMRQVNSRYLSYLGAASYSIYLVQVISLPAFYKLAARMPFIFSNEIHVIMAMLVTLMAGCVLHQYVEKPVAALMKKRRVGIRMQVQ